MKEKLANRFCGAQYVLFLHFAIIHTNVGCIIAQKYVIYYSGKRVVGLSTPSLSNLVKADRHLLLEIPTEWSFEEAATVMVVYSTVLYAFKVVSLILY